MEIINDRAIAIIYKNGKVLTMWRYFKSEEFYVFVGGTQEDNESIDETLKREVLEEVNLKVNSLKKIYSWLHEYEFQGKEFKRNEHYFLITDFEGEVKLGDPEISRTSRDNIYRPSWVTLDFMEKDQEWKPNEIFQIIKKELKV